MEKEQAHIDLKKIIAVREKDNAFTNSLGIHTVLLEPDHSVVEMPVDGRHKNLNNSVHGGCIYSLADNAAGAAASTDGDRVVTMNGNLDFLRPAIHCQKLIAEGKTLKKGKRVIAVEVRITDDTGKLIAAGLFNLSRMKWSYAETIPADAQKA